MKKFKVLISGETINLSKPTLELAKKSKWYSWLNDASIIFVKEYKKTIPINKWIFEGKIKDY